jgi:hypothetical protein
MSAHRRACSTDTAREGRSPQVDTVARCATGGRCTAGVAGRLIRRQRVVGVLTPVAIHRASASADTARR